MNLIHDLFSKIDWEMTTPPSFGIFHFASVVLMVAIIVMIALFLKVNKEKTVKVVLIVCTTLMLSLEVMKQGLFTHEASKYQWYAFPFQFCSTPMYISLLSLIIKNPKIKNALYAFLAFFGLFGGLVVMIYPNDVYTSLVMINIQTMIHHSSQVIMGVTLILAKKVDFDLKTILKASLVFVTLVVIATGMNEFFHYVIKQDATFNMFFISRHYKNHLPILSTIQEKTPFVVFYLTYVFGFMLAAFVVAKFCALIQKLSQLIHRVTWKYAEGKSLS